MVIHIIMALINLINTNIVGKSDFPRNKNQGMLILSKKDNIRI